MKDKRNEGAEAPHSSEPQKVHCTGEWRKMVTIHCFIWATVVSEWSSEWGSEMKLKVYIRSPVSDFVIFKAVFNIRWTNIIA